ncbi:MAG: ATP-dependent DNA helicase, partial [Clostridiales bacterium]|nr:ATP-dependent DNA helicase [Clostridiales bacterium]
MRDITVSVRGIVEFILRSGSIDAGYMSQSRMQDGVKAHQRVQRARRREAAASELEYEPEVRLRLGFEHMGLRWSVSGVADGIVADGDNVTIEEIKSTNRDLDALTFDESHWHMAQAKCYGHMYTELYGAEAIRIDLTYCAVDDDRSRTFSQQFTPGELKAFFYDLIERYSRWAELSFNKKEKRDAAVKAAGFPYAAYRKGQREFAVLAYKAVQNRNKLFIEAPTGTGKTISALFPAVKALGEGLADKVFYLTAKTITRQAAEQAAGMLIDGGCSLTYVAMTARDKLCVLPERICSPMACPMADGHFDRVNDALWALLERAWRITRNEIDAAAREFNVCPYELMLDASLFADIIICDYNYAFDPTVSLKRFFGDAATETYIFLIDEAHNLVERARDMFSATLSRSGFDMLRGIFRGRG